MRTAIFSDVHGNLEALDAVVAEGRRRGAERWLCLGDIVGYGADPAACLESVRRLADVTLLGNHDAAVAGLEGDEYFNAYARRAVEWTRQQLDAGHLDALQRLALTHVAGDVYCVHAEPSDPRAWNYVCDADDAGVALDAVPQRLLFVGHSHLAFVCAAAGDLRTVVRVEGRVQLAAGVRYLVNVGSVGQPRDGDPRACLALYDTDDDAIELVRVAYDIPAARRKIFDAGLPRFLASRLAQGC